MMKHNMDQFGSPVWVIYVFSDLPINCIEQKATLSLISVNQLWVFPSVQNGLSGPSPSSSFVIPNMDKI